MAFFLGLLVSSSIDKAGAIANFTVELPLAPGSSSSTAVAGEQLRVLPPERCAFFVPNQCEKTGKRAVVVDKVGRGGGGGGVNPRVALRVDRPGVMSFAVEAGEEYLVH